MKKTDPIYLRQLVKSDRDESTSNGSFFLVMGSFNSRSEKKTVVQVILKVNEEYRFMEMEMEKIRIKLDSTCKIPYIILSYPSERDIEISRLLKDPDWFIDTYTIVCSEELLPEKLLPIEL